MSSTILVVDDEPGHRKLVVRALAAKGYATRTAPDGAVALEEVVRQPPDAIVSDVLMPEMDGFALVAALRQRGWNLPVVLISAAPPFDDLPEGVTFIGKPFDLTLLVEIVAGAVESSRRPGAEAVPSPLPRPASADRRHHAPPSILRWLRPERGTA